MRFGFLKKFKGPAVQIGKVAGEAALGAAVASNPAVAIDVQLLQASINNGQGVDVNTLNVILVPLGYMVVPLPTGFQPTPGQTGVSTSP